jgi:transposase
LPPAKALLADRGYDADWLRDALADRKIEACIPSKFNRKTQIPHDRLLYPKRHKIENMFGKLRPLRPYLHVSHRYRSSCHLLDMINES